MIVIELTEARLVAGGVVEGSITFDGAGSEDAEVSVLWETAGKGDTDLGVIHFEKLVRPFARHGFRAQLPLLPVTYDGVLVKIGWRVRVRLGAFVLDEPFTVVPIA